MRLTQFNTNLRTEPREKARLRAALPDQLADVRACAFLRKRKEQDE